MSLKERCSGMKKRETGVAENEPNHRSMTEPTRRIVEFPTYIYLNAALNIAVLKENAVSERFKNYFLLRSVRVEGGEETTIIFPFRHQLTGSFFFYFYFSLLKSFAPGLISALPTESYFDREKTVYESSSCARVCLAQGTTSWREKTKRTTRRKAKRKGRFNDVEIKWLENFLPPCADRCYTYKESTELSARTLPIGTGCVTLLSFKVQPPIRFRNPTTRRMHFWCWFDTEMRSKNSQNSPFKRPLD